MTLISLTNSAWANPISALAFSTDGSALVSNGTRKIDVHSPEDGSLKSSLPCDLQKINTLAFDPTGRILAAGGGSAGVNGETWIYDWPRRKFLYRLTNQTDVVTAIAFGSNGKLLGIASADHIARVWKFESTNVSQTEAFTLTGHAGPVLAIAFSPTGQTVVTASADRSIKVWSTADGHLLRTFTQHTESIHALVFRPTTKDSNQNESPFCASAGDDRTVRIWQPEIGRMVRIIRGHQGPVFALAFSPDGKSLYSAGKEGVIRRIDSNSDQILETKTASSDWIYAVAISPDGKKLAFGDWSGTVRIADVNDH